MLVFFFNFGLWEGCRTLNKRPNFLLLECLSLTMFTPRRISETFAVAPALGPGDFAAAAALGYRTILNLLPDGEVASALAANEARRLAAASGLAFIHLPAAKYDLLTDDVVGAAQKVLGEARGPVLATCSSGQRAAIVWAAAAARAEPVDSVLARLSQAGFDFGFLRDDLDAQADRQRWISADADTPLVAA